MPFLRKLSILRFVLQHHHRVSKIVVDNASSNARAVAKKSSSSPSGGKLDKSARPRPSSKWMRVSMATGRRPRRMMRDLLADDELAALVQQHQAEHRARRVVE